jgi:hypothetical protein
MSETTQTEPRVDATPAEAPSLNPEAGIAGAAGFAAAESGEILNLLGVQESGEGCCGGGCCSA